MEDSVTVWYHLQTQIYWIPKPTVFPCDPGSLAGPWSSLTLTTLILSQNLNKAIAVSTPDSFWSLSTCRFCFRNLQAAFRSSSSLSYSAPRAASPWAGFPAGILQNLKFLPSCLSKIPLGLGPLLSILPLTWPISQLLMSPLAKMRKWRHTTKQGSRCPT